MRWRWIVVCPWQGGPSLAKCKVCGTEYTKWRMTQKVCGSVECAAEWAGSLRAKVERKKLRDRKNALKSRSDWAREAQAAVNAFVRERDKELPCISCGRHHQGQWHAGHYLSRGSHPELALDERNIHKQCQPCNTHKSGNQVMYRLGLIARYGDGLVEWLEGAHEPKKYLKDELVEIRNYFREKLRRFKSGTDVDCALAPWNDDATQPPRQEPT